MRPVWRRVVDHFCQAPAVTGDEGDHDEKVDEARRALEAGERSLERINELGVQVDRIAARMKTMRARNHFSELVAEMLREGR